MGEIAWLRTAGAAGIVYMLCSVVAGLIDSATEVDETEAAAAQVAAFMTEGNRIVARVLFLVAALAFLLFLVGLHHRLRRAEGHGVGATAALAGGLVWVSIDLTGAPSTFLAARIPAVAGTPDALVALWGAQLGGISSRVGYGLMLLAAGVVVVSTAALPRWSGWLAVMLGTLTVLDAAVPLGPTVILTGWTFFLNPVWVLLAGAALVARPGVPEAARVPA